MTPLDGPSTTNNKKVATLLESAPINIDRLIVSPFTYFDFARSSNPLRQNPRHSPSNNS